MIDGRTDTAARCKFVYRIAQLNGGGNLKHRKNPLWGMLPRIVRRGAFPPAAGPPSSELHSR